MNLSSASLLLMIRIAFIKTRKPLPNSCNSIKIIRNNFSLCLIAAWRIGLVGAEVDSISVAIIFPGSQALVSFVLERELPSEPFSLVAEEVSI